MMKTAGSLQISFHRGKAFAAYLYLPHDGPHRVARSQEMPGDLVLDFGEDGEVIGVEILSPGTVTAQQVNKALGRFNIGPVDELELAPLRVA